MRNVIIGKHKQGSGQFHYDQRLTEISISPRGTMVAAQGDDDGYADHKKLHLFAFSENPFRPEPTRQIEIENGFFGGYAFSPDGRQLAMLTFTLDFDSLTDEPQSPQLRIYDLANGHVIQTFPVCPESPDVVWSPDSQTLFTTGTTLRSWSVESGRLNWEWPTHDHIETVGISPDGSHIAVQGRTFDVLKTDSGRQVWTIDLNIAANGIHWVHDIQRVITRTAMQLYCWDGSNGDFIREIEVGYNGRCSCCVSQDGSTIIDFSRKKEIICISTETGRVVDSLGAVNNAPRAILLHNDDAVLIVIDEKNEIHRWTTSSAPDTTVAAPRRTDLFELPALQVSSVESSGRESMLRTQPPACDLSRIPVFRTLARTTIRLHPRRTNTPLPPDVSKMGGADLLPEKPGGGVVWPCDQPWPRCEEHGESLLPVLQLLAKDFPQFPFPHTRDVFQLMWCPRDHESCGWAPKSHVFWWRLEDVSTPFAETPVLLADGAQDNYAPYECQLHPEPVIEFPELRESDLPDELHQVYDELQKSIPHMQFYSSLLASAPGTKLGGHPSWIQDPEYPLCDVTGEAMEHLLTIASWECDGGSFRRWLTVQERPIYDGTNWEAAHQLVNPTGLLLGDAGSIYVFHSKQASPDQIKTVFHCS